MALFNSRDPKRNRGSWWDVLKVDPGKPVTCWLAGAPLGVVCHFIERANRACRRVFSDNELPCPYCADGIAPRWRGYVPLWGEDGRRYLVIMGDRYWPALQEVKHLDPVNVRKLHQRGNPLGIFPLRSCEKRVILPAADMAPQDITGVLLTMWGDPVLSDWVRSRAVAAVADPPAAPAAPPKRKARPAARTPETPADVTGGTLGAAVAARMLAAEGHDALSQVMQRISQKAPGLNGDHKAKPR